MGYHASQAEAGLLGEWAKDVLGVAVCHSDRVQCVMVGATLNCIIPRVVHQISFLCRDLRQKIRCSIIVFALCVACIMAEAMKALVRIGRYLIDHPRMMLHYDWQGHETEISAYSDSD